MNILDEAKKITSNDRQDAYGSPEENFEKISKLASILLGKELTSRDIVLIMICVKLSRETNCHKRDNLVDLAGYAWVLSKVGD